MVDLLERELLVGFGLLEFGAALGERARRGAKRVDKGRELRGDEGHRRVIEMPVGPPLDDAPGQNLNRCCDGHMRTDCDHGDAGCEQGRDAGDAGDEDFGRERFAVGRAVAHDDPGAARQLAAHEDVTDAVLADDRRMAAVEQAGIEGAGRQRVGRGRQDQRR